MGRAVRPNDPCPVEHEKHGKFLKRELLEDLVVAALQERAVDVHNRPQPGFGLPRSEGHCMGFTDARVEESPGEFVADRFQLVALAHGGCHYGHTFVAPHLIADGGEVLVDQSVVVVVQAVLAGRLRIR